MGVSHTRCSYRVPIKGMVNKWRDCKRYAVHGQFCNQHHPDKMTAVAKLKRKQKVKEHIKEVAQRRLGLAAPALLQALELMLSDYRTEGCPDPNCGICKGSAAASKAAYDAIELALGKDKANGR